MPRRGNDRIPIRCEEVGVGKVVVGNDTTLDAVELGVEKDEEVREGRSRKRGVADDEAENVGKE